MQPRVRDALVSDLADIVRVAALAGEDHEWAGGDERYLQHLLAHGQLVVAEEAAGLVGYAATRTLEGPAFGCVMLCDLFVAPAVRGAGVGRALLSALWHESSARMTFSSTHPAALPLYASFGLMAWWPLLYLIGEVSRLPAFPDCSASQVPAGEAAGLEREWTRVDRAADYVAWEARPGGAAFVVRRGDTAVATGVLGGEPLGLEHLRLAPAVDDDTADAALCSALGCAGADGPMRVRLPGSHPALPVLLAAGWRIEDHDLFMATRRDLLDPARDVPSPALG